MITLVLQLLGIILENNCFLLLLLFISYEVRLKKTQHFAHVHGNRRSSWLRFALKQGIDFDVSSVVDNISKILAYCLFVRRYADNVPNVAVMAISSISRCPLVARFCRLNQLAANDVRKKDYRVHSCFKSKMS